MDSRGRFCMAVEIVAISPRHVLAYGKKWLKRSDGYYYRRYRVGPRKANKKVTEYLHREIYLREVGQIPDGWLVHHRDEDKGNNDVSNLELMSRPDHNVFHSTGRPTTDKQKQAARENRSNEWAKQAWFPCVCEWCGKDFQSRNMSEKPRFCNTKCRDKSRYRTDPRRTYAYQKARRLQSAG